MAEFQKIYQKTLYETLSIDSGYLVSYKILNGKHSYLSIDTMWVEQDDKFEIIKPGLVKSINAKHILIF